MSLKILSCRRDKHLKQHPQIRGLRKDRKGTVGAGEENAPSTLPYLSDQETSSKDTHTDSKGKAKKEGMETDPPSL
jgi:hypothetical protein